MNKIDNLNFTPRPYQLFYATEMKNSTKRINLLESPAGTGKTKTFTTLAFAIEFEKNILFVSHRINLARQTLKDLKFKEKIGLLQGATKRNLDARVVICTIESLRNGLKNKTLPRKRWDYIFFDECHTMGKAQMDIAKLLPSKCKVIGLTATPYNADGSPLNMYDGARELNGKYDTDYFLENGYILDVDYIKAGNAIDESKLKTSSTGDYTQKSVDEAVEDTASDILKMSLPYMYGQTIVFASNIDHALELKEEFSDVSVKCRIARRGETITNFHTSPFHHDRYTHLKRHFNLDSTIKYSLSVDVMHSPRKKDKYKINPQEVLDRFKRDEYQILINVSQLSAGTDVPQIECVILANPTKSHSKARQEITRGARPCPSIGKKIFRVIDCAGVYDNVGHPYEKPYYDENENGDNKNSKPKCEHCNSIEIELIDSWVDEDEGVNVRKYKCLGCGEETLKLSAIKGFECSSCNAITRENKETTFKDGSNIIGVCKKCQTHNIIRKLVPLEMITVYRDRGNALTIIEDRVKKQNIDDRLKIDIIKLLRVDGFIYTDKFLESLMKTSMNLEGVGTNRTYQSYLNIQKKFNLFSFLNIIDHKTARHAIYSMLNISKGAELEINARRMKYRVREWSKKTDPNYSMLLKRYITFLKKESAKKRELENETKSN